MGVEEATAKGILRDLRDDVGFFAAWLTIISLTYLVPTITCILVSPFAASGTATLGIYLWRRNLTPGPGLTVGFFYLLGLSTLLGASAGFFLNGVYDAILVALRYVSTIL